MSNQRQQDSADLVLVIAGIVLAVFSVVFVIVMCGFNWEV